eukprot:9071965-Alexandrium_andersonii.AAC.1
MPVRPFCPCPYRPFCPCPCPWPSPRSRRSAGGPCCSPRLSPDGPSRACPCTRRASSFSPARRWSAARRS